MTKREFNTLLKLLTSKAGRIDEQKVKALSDTDKIRLMHYIVRAGGPLLTAFILPSEKTWLSCMGYLYAYYTKAGFSFLGTSRHLVCYGDK